MLVTRAYKVELALNNAQVTACKRHAGAARFAYNWGLVRKREAYEAGGPTPSAIDLHRELVTLKHTTLPWLAEVSKWAPQEALRDLDVAYARFFRRCRQRKEGTLLGKVGVPRRKSRKRGLGSFRLYGAEVVAPDVIRLPRVGRVRLKQRGYLPPSGAQGVEVLWATVSEQAGHWYVSLQVRVEQPVPVNAGPAVGVDLGIKALATLSDGTVIHSPSPLRRSIKKVRRLHRGVTRKPRGSRNRRKAVRRLARLYRRIANQRANTLHQVTTMLVKTKSVIVVEDLNVAGMLKNHHLARAIADVGFAEFRRQLAYKAAWYGCRVVVVSRWEPSSQICCRCGWRDVDLTLADRLFRCEECGSVMDRDLNAATNLSKLAGSSPESLNACGVGGAGRGCEAPVEPPATKQEPGIRHLPVG